MQSEWRLYSIYRREKNKGDQFLIPMKLFRVIEVLVSDLKMIAKKERTNHWDRKIICRT